MSVSQALEDRHPSNAVQPVVAPRQPSVFKRHQTVASLPSVGAVSPCDAPDKSPTHINHLIPGGVSVEEQRRIRDSLRRQQHAKGVASIMATNTPDVDAGAAAAAATVVCSQRTGRKLQNRLSGEGAPMSSINQPKQTLRKLGRTPSSPSVLFSRVKERIREKVFETSAEWPHMAAVERERRIRAAQAFEQALRDSMTACSNTKHAQSQRQASHQLVVRTVTGTGVVTAGADDGTMVSGGEKPISTEKTRRVRIKSDPSRKTVASTSSTEAKGNEGSHQQQLPQQSTSMLARLAFRRRSISEDTYILETKMVAAAAASAETTCGGRLLGPDSSAKNNSQGDGVVCSNEDLKEIVNRHKARRSPVLSPTTTTTTIQPTISDSRPASVQQLSISDDVLARLTLSSTCGLASTITTESYETASVWTSPVGTSKSDAVTNVSSEHASNFSLLGPPAGVVINTDVADSGIGGGGGGGGGVQDERFDHVGPDADEVELNSGVDMATKTIMTSVTVRDVVYDEHGQTWDVYGADFDPEILGQAIQAYLDKIMSKKLRKNTSRETVIRDELTNDGLSINPRAAVERQTGRSFGLFMRHLCSPLWRQQHQSATTNS